MIQAVIFDLDGTLLNTIEDLRAAVNYALGLRNLPFRTTEQTLDSVGNGIRNLIRLSMSEGTPDADIDAALADFRAYYGEHLMDLTQPYPGIPELLRDLKAQGIRIGVLSNKIDTASRRLIAHFFGELVDVTLGERPGIPRKPDPTSCREMLERLGAQPENTLYVGDSDVDMMTAHNAGLKALGVTWGFRTRELLLKNGAQVLIETPEQIAQLARES